MDAESRTDRWFPLVSVVFLTAFAAGSLEAQQCTVEFSEAAVLGQLDDSASVQVPLNISVAAVPWGGWLVAEQDQGLLRYHGDGSLGSAFVQVGQGPGELQSPELVVVDATDSTWISDYHGRALVYAPGGSLSRTVTHPSMDYVHGFTPGGLPYTQGVTLLGGPAESPDVALFLRTMDRMGRKVGTYRPGAPGLRDYPAQWAPRIHALSDSVFRYPVEEQQVIQTWAGGSVTSSFDLAKVGPLVGARDLRPDDILALGVFPAENGGTWLAMRVRRLSQEREEALVEAAPSVPGYDRSETSSRAFSPPIANQVWDGVFIRISAEGEVSAVGTTEQYPYGFSGPRQFVTATETDFGLVQLHVWDFGQVCR